MRNKSNFMAWILLTITVVMWGMSFLSIKVTIAVLPTMTQALLRHVIASFVLFFIVKRIEPQSKLNKKDYPMFLVAGLLGITLYFYFENSGIQRITASTASMIIAVVPILMILSDALIYRTHLSGRKIMSVLISFTGVYMIVGNTPEQSSNTLIGYVFMFGAVISWVAYTLVTKSLFDRYSELTIVYYQTLFGTATLVPFLFFEKTNWSLINGSVILNILFLGLFCSAFASYIYVICIDRLGVGACSLMMNLIPVVAVTASFFILQEKITILQGLGGLAVIIAVVLCDQEKKDLSMSVEYEDVKAT